MYLDYFIDRYLVFKHLRPQEEPFPVSLASLLLGRLPTEWNNMCKWVCVQPIFSLQHVPYHHYSSNRLESYKDFFFSFLWIAYQWMTGRLFCLEPPLSYYASFITCLEDKPVILFCWVKNNELCFKNNFSHIVNFSLIYPMIGCFDFLYWDWQLLMASIPGHGSPCSSL